MSNPIQLNDKEIVLLLLALDFYRTKAIAISSNLMNPFAEEIKALKDKIEEQTTLVVENTVK